MKSGNWLIMALVMCVLEMALPHIAVAWEESQTVEIDRITWRYTVTAGKKAHLIRAAPAEDKPGVPQINPKTVTIPSSFPSNCTLTSIGSNAFAATQYWNWTNMVEVTIPKGVTSIGDKAFYCCYNLRRVSMPDTVRSIGASAFENCALTTSIHLPQQLTTIGERAFAMCLYLDYLYIPVNVETIGKNAFYSIHMEKLFAPTTWSNRAPFQSTGMASGFDIRYVLTAQVVTFNANGGNCSTQSLTYTSDLPYGILPDATRSEYAFAGWWTSPSGPGIQVTESNTVSHAETLMLYARWTPTKQVVYFNANGGNCSATSQTYAVGAKYGTFPEATREDYTFQGWWTEQNGGVLIATTNIAPAEETRTLYAHWTPLKQSVTFDSNGGTCDTDSRIYSVGSTYSPLPNASRENYTFMGWWTSSSGGEQVLETDQVTEEERRVLYAHWTLAYQIVSFEANGGTCSTDSRRYSVGEAYSSFPEAIWEPYCFLGWWTSAEGGEQVLGTDLVPAVENRTLYAHWTEKNRVVRFDPNGGDCDTETHIYTMGDTYTPLPTVTCAGYVFLGWFTEKTAGMQICSSNLVNATNDFTLYAHWTVEGEKNWEYFVTNGMATITKGPGKGELAIPFALGGYPVTGIGSAAFSACDALTTVTIPDGVTIIGTNAFRDCSGLKSVTIPSSVTRICSYAFQGCNQLTSVIIHDLVSWCSISFGGSSGNPLLQAHHLYLDGEEITNLVIPAGVTNIGDKAFYGCSGLTNVTIPEGVVGIGSMAFRNCSGLTSVVIPNSVKSIEISAFNGCDGLTSVVIHDLAAWLKIVFTDPTTNPLQFAHHLYLDEEEIVNLIIPNGVTSIGSYAFYGCSGLTNITFPDSVWSIGACAFRDCKGLKSLTFSKRTDTIGNYAFSGCSGLTNLTLPNSLLNIGTNAFNSCSGLTSVDIPASVSNIGKGAFTSCGGLSSVNIHDLVAWLRISFGNSRANPLSCAGHLYLNGEEITNLVVPDSVTTIGKFALYGCAGLTNVTIPDSVTSIGNDAFSECSGLKTLYVPASWKGTEILDHAGVPSGCAILYGTSDLVIAFDANGGECDTQIHVYADGEAYGWLPEATRTHYAFAGWWTAADGGAPVVATDIASVDGPETLYAHWTLTEQVVRFDANGGVCGTGNHTYAVGKPYGWLPEAERGEYSFAGWFTERDGGEPIDESSMVTAKEARTLYAQWNADEPRVVWRYSVEDGKATVTGASPASGNLTIPSTLGGYPVTGIGNRAFYGCSDLASVTIPDSVSIIGEGAFQMCRGLTSVEMDNGMANIGDFAFSWCTELTSVNIPASVTNLGNCAFQMCFGLTNMVIPDNVSNIGGNAFGSCSGLRDVVIGDGVTNIGQSAFSYCSQLTTVKIGNGVASIGGGAFSGCNQLTSVIIHDLVSWCRISFGGSSGNPLQQAHHLYLDGEEITNLVIPAAVANIGDNAFSGCSGLTNLTIAGNVTNDWEYAGPFDGCTNLTTVVLGENMTRIGSYMFYGCSNLVSVAIQGNITDIGTNAFAKCPGIVRVEIPQIVCSSRLSRVFPAAYASIAEVIIGNAVTNIGDNVFLECVGLTHVVISDSVTDIGSHAFWRCVSLTNVSFGGHVAYIGEQAFSDCSRLTSVTLPDSVTNIGPYAFYCCGLRSVTIPDSVTSIGEDAFRECSGLANVTIGNNVADIGQYAFAYCGGLTSVAIPDSVMSIGYGIFDECCGLKTLYVPESWKTKYVNGQFWSNYAAVPEGCEIFYSVPKTCTGVPYAWLEERRLGDGTPDGYEAAAAAEAANRAYTVADCYVAGLDPTDPTATFTAVITYTNGAPMVSWSPDLNEKNTKSLRSYEVEGKTTMTNAWGATNAASRFFRVKVGLPTK